MTQTVTTEAAGAEDVYAADVDGDNDPDILAAYGSGTVAWYENDGATNPIFTQHTVTTNADGPNSVYAADVDGDSDTDILSTR